MNMRSVFNFFKNLTGRIDSTPFSSGGDSTDSEFFYLVEGYKVAAAVRGQLVTLYM